MVAIRVACTVKMMFKSEFLIQHSSHLFLHLNKSKMSIYNGCQFVIVQISHNCKMSAYNRAVNPNSAGF